MAERAAGKLFAGTAIFPGREFTGAIDDLALWSRTLSAAEIGDIYNAGVAGDGLDALGAGLPLQVALTDGGTTLTFTWARLRGRLYELRSAPALDTPPDSWPVWNGHHALDTDTLTIPRPPDPDRFFAILERRAP